MAINFTTDTYLVRLDCADGLLRADDGPADEFRLGMFLRRLNEDDQYIRVNHEGRTFMQLKASTWDHEPLILQSAGPEASSFACEPAILQSTRPVKRIEINVRQRFTELNTNDYKDRVYGFRIAMHELLLPSSSGQDRFEVSASG